MVYGADGALGLCAHHPDRLRTGARLAPGSAQIRLALPDEFRLGPGERKIRSAALHLRYARLILDRASDSGAAQRRHRGLSDRTRAATVAARADALHRTSRGRAERDPRPVGHLRHGAVAA